MMAWRIYECGPSSVMRYAQYCSDRLIHGDDPQIGSGDCLLPGPKELSA
jgi:hypothetical protein